MLLASASYMTDDVQLVPMVTANLSDIGASSFDKSDWTFLFHDLKVFEESVGSLKKSRAQFVMHVLRDASPYMSSTIFPEIMIVVLSFTETCLRRTFEMPKHFLGAFMVLDNIFDGSSYSSNSRIFSMFVIGLQVFLFPVNPGFAMPRVSSVTSSVTQCPAACCYNSSANFQHFQLHHR